MSPKRYIIFILFVSVIMLSCSKGFEVTTTQDQNDLDLVNTETTYMVLKQGDAIDPGTILMKLQSALSKDNNKSINRIHFVYQGEEWTNMEYAQILASFSTYTLKPDAAPVREMREPDGIEENFWVVVPKGVFGKIINSNKWSITLHSEKRILVVCSKETEEAESKIRVLI